MRKLYLAGGLFNAGERLHNLYLEKYLKELGIEAVLPQREALQFLKGDHFDVDAIVEDCQKQCTHPDNLYVGSADGSDADSGTAIEYGMAIATNGKAIVYRTDFRTAPEKEIGLNAMFRAKGTTFVYQPCFFTELNQVDAYYRDLAKAIWDAVQSLTE